MKNARVNKANEPHIHAGGIKRVSSQRAKRASMNSHMNSSMDDSESNERKE